MRNKKRKAGGNNRLLVSLFLSGHALGLAPTGIQFHTLAAEFDDFVSAYTNIILFLSLQLAHIFHALGIRHIVVHTAL